MNASSATLQLGAGSRRSQATGIGLWVFIAVASTLFALFITAYAMRMLDAPDWSRVVMPWQLWLSSLWLAAGSLSLHVASRRPDERPGLWLHLGGACAVAFVLTQWSAWQALQQARVALAGNPAASFFYLLTALHALHVVGGLVAWGLTLRDGQTWRIALCARYWHFLLVVWLLLFAALGWMTPEFVAFICGRG
jgi:cytochrome c oxidase subunit III